MARCLFLVLVGQTGFSVVAIVSLWREKVGEGMDG